MMTAAKLASWCLCLLAAAALCANGGEAAAPAAGPKPAAGKPAVEPAAEPAPKPARPMDKLEFTFGGKVEAGLRNIAADRATGNESSTYYRLDIYADACFDEQLGARMRLLFRTPVSKRARSHELFDDLNDEFEVREMYLYYRPEGLGEFKFGKFKLPFGPADHFEDEPWNQPLLEYYIARTGNYDIGGLWDMRWFGGCLRTRASLTSGNTGSLDTNSALAGAGSISYCTEWLDFGVWAKTNRLDTTPIKRNDHAAGVFVEMEYRNWKLLAKYAWLQQGLRTTNFTQVELEGFDYDDNEIDTLLWLRDNGGESRTLNGCYLLLSAPTLHDVPIFGRTLDRVDLFAHIGQVFDPADPFEHNRERLGLGANILLKDTGRARLFLSTGITFDDDTSNTRPYLERLDDIDRRNDRFTYWVKIAVKF